VRRLGSRTTAAVALLVAIGVVAFRTGRLRPDRLAGMDPWALLVIGALSATSVAALFRLWGLWRPRDPGLTPIDSDSEMPGTPPELPPAALAMVYLVAFLMLGLFAFDRRAVARLRAFPAELAAPGSEYCKPEASVEEEKKGPPLKPGCQLVIRAYELGFAKSLGDCAPGAEEEDGKAKRPCELRQLDEPYLHYFGRLLATRATWFVDTLTSAAPASAAAHFVNQTTHVNDLYEVQADSVGARARSSHHLFTNLPRPYGAITQVMGDQVGQSGCEATVGKRKPWNVKGTGAIGPSLALEHVVSQLLFSPAYQPNVGPCNEFVIHWGAPTDVCAKLAKDPVAVLRGYDALSHVQGVIERRERGVELEQLGGETTKAPAPSGTTPSDVAAPLTDVPPTDQVVSFQCFVQAPVTGGMGSAFQEHPMRIGKTTFVARELRVPKVTADERGQLSLYQWLAHLICPGFGYSRIMSLEAAGDETADESVRGSLSTEGTLLTKLRALREIDVFLGHDWLYTRPDLLEVYPYHLHLSNLIGVFRERYKLERGRL